MESVTLTLFDIDGTLLCGEGSGRGAMIQAASELFNRPDIFDNLSFAGGVDSSIVRTAIAGAGLPVNHRRVARLHARYVRRLIRTLQQAPGYVCPGVPEIVRAAQQVSHVGLLTGNWVDGARAKLRALDLWDDFDGCVGAFGGDAQDRNDLVPIAWMRARRRWENISRVIVIGDTPADVRCAKAGNAKLQAHGVEVLSVAVETGFASREAIAAAEPDLQISDFESGWTSVLSLIAG